MKPINENDINNLIHNDAMVAIFYKVTKSPNESFVLKICTRSEDYQLNRQFIESFFRKLRKR